MGKRVPIVEAAEAWTVSTKTIRRRIADGTLPAYRVGERLIRVDLDDVDKLARPIPAGNKERAAMETFELSDAEVEILGELCRCLDELEMYARAVKEQGVTVTGSRGQLRPNPCLEAARATRTVLGRLVSQLSLPDPEDQSVPSQTTLRARNAARARWDRVEARRQARGSA